MLLKPCKENLCVIIAISGTPGTGKTAVARILGKQLNAKLISAKSLLGKIKFEYDKKRKTKIIAIKDLQKAVDKEIEKSRINIVDSHLSHLVKADVAVVLRTDPLVLKKRLHRRGWATSKIKENITAELLDETTTEALEKHGRKVFEVNTTHNNPERTASIIKFIVKNKPSGFKPGKIKWLAKYKKRLKEFE